MVIIEAISITEDVRSILSSRRSFRLLNLFNRACNLIDETDGTIISILSKGAYRAPLSLIVPLDNMPIHFETGWLYCKTHEITTYSLTISTANTPLWDSRLDLGKLKKEQKLAMIYLGKQALVKHHESLAQAYLNLAPVESPLHQLDLQEMGRLINMLLGALVSNDMSTLAQSVKGLAGRGIGLTPAGDDWLLGCMLALQAHQLCEVAQTIAHIVIPLTTPVSAMYFKMAVKLKYAETWHLLFSAQTESHIQNAIQAILSQGFSSGADALTGFIQTTEILKL